MVPLKTETVKCRGVFDPVRQSNQRRILRRPLKGPLRYPEKATIAFCKDLLPWLGLGGSILEVSRRKLGIPLKKTHPMTIALPSPWSGGAYFRGIPSQARHTPKKTPPEPDASVFGLGLFCGIPSQARHTTKIYSEPKTP